MTRREIESVIWRATMMILGYDPDSTDQSVLSKVRNSWPLSEMGSPNWSRTEDVVFIRLAPVMDDYNALWDISHGTDSNGEYKEQVSNHQSYEVNWLCYGPDALETAEKLRYGVLRENIRAYLTGANIAFKTVLRMPVHFPEQDRSGDWWERYDVNAVMYEKDTRYYSEQYVETAPNISTSYAAYPEFVLDKDKLDVDSLGSTVTVSMPN